MPNEETWKFIEENKGKSLAEVALLLGKKKEFSKEFILNQINGWQRSKSKIPEWHSVEGIVFPDKLSLEQASSERTAIYKSNLVKGENMADLTGGLGIDCYYFSKKFKKVYYIEPDKERFDAASLNFRKLGAQNIEPYNCYANDFLDKAGNLDFIYVDPDRRDKNKKLVRIEDCSPDLTLLQERIFSHAKYLMVKYSPMLDISLALEQLKMVKQVQVVSVENECKEILFLAENGNTNESEIVAVNFRNGKKEFFTFYPSEEKITSAEIGSVEKYLYDPNTSIKKAGAFKLISTRFDMKKLHSNTHLYSSENYLENFPGRIFEVLREARPKEIKSQKLNVISRNFPLDAGQIKSKYKIKDGGENYLLAATLHDSSKKLLLCKRID